MANEQNLIKGGAAHRLTVEEASKGGKASGEARRRKREIREIMEVRVRWQASRTATRATP